MKSSLATKCQHFKLRGLQVHYIKWQKKGHLEASEDIITKFKPQGLYTIKIKYWKASGSGFLPSLIPTLQNRGILHHKKAKLRKHMRQSVVTILQHNYFSKIASTTTLKKCKYQGDMYCDDRNNHAGCDFDGGDCCIIPTVNQFCSECWCYANHTSYVSGKNNRSKLFLNGTC